MIEIENHLSDLFLFQTLLSNLEQKRQLCYYHVWINVHLGQH